MLYPFQLINRSPLSSVWLPFFFRARVDRKHAACPSSRRFRCWRWVWMFAPLSLCRIWFRLSWGLAVFCFLCSRGLAVVDKLECIRYWQCVIHKTFYIFLKHVMSKFQIILEQLLQRFWPDGFEKVFDCKFLLLLYYQTESVCKNRNVRHE